MPSDFQENLETYTIHREVGRDDLTIAYEARRKSDDQPVLLKVVAPQFTFDTYFIMRFKDAVARNVKLEHPNIIKTFEVGERDDILYAVQEFLEAEPLADYLERNAPLSVTETVELVKQIAAALDYAHSKTIRHGDLSDTTVKIGPKGQIWLTDFGITQAVEGTSLAKKGFAVGNPAYMSPERVKGESTSRTADLYALGILSYQMLTGQLPFSGDPAAIMHAHIYTQPQSPHLLNSSIRPMVSDAVLRMLSKGLELRHSTGAEFARALQVAAEGSAPVKPQPKTDVTVGTPKVTTSTPPRPSVKTNQTFLWVLLLAPILGCALAAGFWFINQWATVFSETPVVIATPVLKNIVTPVPTFRFSGPTATPVIVAGSLIPSPTPAATTPSLHTPIPRPPQPVINPNSPFSNFVLAHNITADFKPDRPDTVFPATKDPVYLFFDYNGIKTGELWEILWLWDDREMQKNTEIWPATYGDAGTAWVYFSPPQGFQPGPYSVSVSLNNQVVATIYFVIQPE